MSGNSDQRRFRNASFRPKFAHAVSAHQQIPAKQMVDWYKTVLQAEVVFENRDAGLHDLRR